VSIRSVHEYLETMRWRYLAATKKQKSRIIDEVCAALQYHRKAAIRALRRPVGEQPSRAGRPLTYGPLVDAALRQVSEIADDACGKRLAPFLPELVDALERCGALTLDPAVRDKLVRMSAASVDRHLAPYRRSFPRQPYRATSPSSIKAQIPIRTFGEWSGVQPGSVQADLVLHCGQSLAGFFLTTLVVTDVATGWTDCEALYGMTKQRVGGGLHFVSSRLPIRIRELHTDNGSEFLNSLLFPYCQRKGIAMSRGRPYKKNDQAYVEERNGAVVRRLVGYDRYSNRDALALLNQYYAWLRLYLNHFQPIRKLVSKERVGAKVRRVYDDAATPYRRMLASGVLTGAERERLERVHAALNPVKLKAGMQETIRELHAFREPARPTSKLSLERLEMGGRLMMKRTNSVTDL
jgi:transposase InsO family protein